jgi:hypothetical protein
MIKFYMVHEVIRYASRPAFTSEVLPGIWEEAVLVNRLGQDRLAELVRYPKILEEILPS